MDVTLRNNYRLNKAVYAVVYLHFFMFKYFKKFYYFVSIFFNICTISFKAGFI